MSANAASADQGRVVALFGGVSGAKLTLGFSKVLPSGILLVAAITGDDFQHPGLSISSDLDTVMYEVARIKNPQTGWGRRNEAWSFITVLKESGGETWFKLGDKDCAVHVKRTRRLAAGEMLLVITDDFCARWSIGSQIVPNEGIIDGFVLDAVGSSPADQLKVLSTARIGLAGQRTRA
jgi:LPPG:FO 2-phospho-L-lactate transferase